jgi:hypothetical protein
MAHLRVVLLSYGYRTLPFVPVPASAQLGFKRTKKGEGGRGDRRAQDIAKKNINNPTITKKCRCDRHLEAASKPKRRAGIEGREHRGVRRGTLVRQIKKSMTMSYVVDGIRMTIWMAREKGREREQNAQTGLKRGLLPFSPSLLVLPSLFAPPHGSAIGPFFVCVTRVGDPCAVLRPACPIGYQPAFSFDQKRVKRGEEEGAGLFQG